MQNQREIHKNINKTQSAIVQNPTLSRLRLALSRSYSDPTDSILTRQFRRSYPHLYPTPTYIGMYIGAEVVFWLLCCHLPVVLFITPLEMSVEMRITIIS